MRYHLDDTNFPSINMQQNFQQKDSPQGPHTNTNYSAVQSLAIYSTELIKDRHLEEINFEFSRYIKWNQVLKLRFHIESYELVTRRKELDSQESNLGLSPSDSLRITIYLKARVT